MRKMESDILLNTGRTGHGLAAHSADQGNFHLCSPAPLMLPLA
jgi:hypothetical protein